MSGSLFGPSTTPTSYNLQRPSTQLNQSTISPTNTTAVAGSATALGIITTCNYYATIIGYITVLVIGYLIVSWVISLFGGGSSQKKKDYDDDVFEDIDDDEPPKRKRKKQD